MTIVVQATDNFNRANETPLSNAGKWSAGAVAAAGQFDLAGNIAIPHGVSDTYSAWEGRVWTNDQSSKAKLTVTGTNTEAGIGLSVRYSAAASNAWGYFLTGEHAASGNMNFSRRLNGTYANLLIFTEAFTNGDTWQLTVEGPSHNATLKAYHNGTLVASFTDTGGSTIPLPGSPGIVFYSSATSPSVDDWEGGELVADTPPVNATPNVAWWGA